jgi:hypothetical protein
MLGKGRDTRGRAARFDPNSTCGTSHRLAVDHHQEERPRVEADGATLVENENNPGASLLIKTACSRLITAANLSRSCY